MTWWYFVLFLHAFKSLHIKMFRVLSLRVKQTEKGQLALTSGDKRKFMLNSLLMS